MSEWKLFTGEVPHVSTFDFHEHRERAPHLEQPDHRPRLLTAFGMVLNAAGRLDRPTVSDLGCGDGGLLSIVKPHVTACWGYDFAPANRAGWRERGVDAEQVDCFGADRARVVFGDITVTTEVLEHLADPHGTVRWIESKYLVASSPWNEHAGAHDECHAWAWDVAGYRELIRQGGYDVLEHVTVGRFQVVLGERS